MKDQLLQSWKINNDKNLLLVGLDNIALEKTLSTKAGRTVAGQLAHMHNVRINWLEFVAKPLFDKSIVVTDKSPGKEILERSFKLSFEKINQVMEISWEKQGKLPSFKTGLIPFIAYLISHESHHRGNILLTLKQSGFKVDDKIKYGLWEWGK